MPQVPQCPTTRAGIVDFVDVPDQRVASPCGVTNAAHLKDSDDLDEAGLLPDEADVVDHVSRQVLARPVDPCEWIPII
ncbi:hypothetical protein GCM10010411_74880 [Actinomadura fulvescens]|uniref:Uncharacterized protein n=1 Tax=Actinomadura fulvescens TaxID=46160 RepID=A0ABP6CUI2_9ACTN